jgi:tyrosinase
LSIVFDLERTNQLSLLPDKDLVDLCPPIEPYQVTKNHKCDFDGLYEQPHDNIHGWVGYDMADNAYTAFDPIFWSYHANIDRVFENWKREHPAATYTSNFPILPFMGSLANRVDFTDNRAYLRTTIGDMAKDSRSIGYDYEPPKIPDSSGTTFNEWSDYLYIIFNDVKCTYDTYSIDVFVNQSNPQPKDAECGNLHFVGKMMRLGMGIKDDKGRCIKDGVTRVLDASYNAYYLTPRITPDSDVEISLIVTDVRTGKILTPEEYNKLPGFKATYMWGKGIPSTKLDVSCSHERCD